MITATGGGIGLPVAETYSTNVGYRVVSQNVCYLFFTGCVLKVQPFLYSYKGGNAAIFG